MAFLILFPNNIADKEALYSVAENAEVLEEYKGWWSYKDGELLLSMTMYGGRDYVEGRGLYGTYTEVTTELADMALEHKYGDSLTIYMSNSGKEFFNRSYG